MPPHAFLSTLCWWLQVHLSKDRSQVSILWDCFPSQAKQCTTDLARLQGRMRSALAERLDLRKVPSLVFSRDMLTPSQGRAAAVLDALQVERDGERAEGEEGAAAASGGGDRRTQEEGGGLSADAHVEAATAALRSQMRRKPWDVRRPRALAVESQETAMRGSERQ